MGRCVSFLLFHIVFLTFLCKEMQKMITKAFRRRGKELVPQAHIALTNDHGELFRAVVRRDTPFRSASSDVGQTWGRCNCDFQFMPRALEPEQFRADSAAKPVAPEVNPKLALAMYGIRLQLPEAPLLRRCFHSVVAMFQAAHNCDYYITKYQGKPMAQLGNLLEQIATGLQRLESEEAENDAAHGLPDTAPARERAEDRARRATLKIAGAANRSSWVYCCEMASFIRTGGDCRKTHRPVHVFLSRPKYMLEECRRILQ